MHAVVPPLGLLDATNAPGTCESEIFNEHTEGKEIDWMDKESDMGEQSGANGSLSYRLGVQECAFLMQNVMV